MWRGEDGTLLVFEPSEAALRKFANYTQITQRPYQLPGGPNIDKKKKIQIPPRFLTTEGHLRDYQETAITNWLKNNGEASFIWRQDRVKQQPLYQRLPSCIL